MSKSFTQRIALKSTHKQHEYRAALERIMLVLYNGGKNIDDRAYEADALFAVCSKIGKFAGIIFRKPEGNVCESYQEPLQLICRYSAVRTRKVMLRVSEQWWSQDNGALLCFSKKENKPCALLPEGNAGYRLWNPELADAVYVNRTVAETIADEAWTFYRPLPEKPLLGKELLKFGLFGSKSDALQLLVFGLIASLFGLLTPILTGVIFGDIIPKSDRGQLLQVTLILIASIISVAAFNLAKQIIVLRLQNRIDMAIQPALIDRLLNLPSNFFRSYSSGDLAMRVMGISQIREILSSSAIGVFLGLLFGISNLFLLFYYSWKLALVALFMTFIIFALTSYISLRQISFNRDAVAVQGKISGMLGNLLGGIAKIKITGTESMAFAKWSFLFIQERFVKFQAGKLENLLMVVTTVFPTLFMVVIIYAAVKFMQADLLIPYMLNKFKLTPGSFMSFTSAYTAFQITLIQVVITIIGSLNVIPLYERLKPVLETIPEADERKKYPGKLTGAISIQNVNFSYSCDGPQILHDVTFIAAPGEFVALVGGSGSGKSTLLRLLLGFEKPDLGTVYYDGEDLTSFNVQAVRHQIGVVMQNGQLQPGFILHNIIGASTFTIDDAWEAARMAGLEDDIKMMPMGMHTFISEGSGTLSGGQRQRLLIASALVRKPNIIFFDEATSALDNRTQEVVSSSLEQLKATRIVIAHRLSTIRNADRIYCLDKGHIVQSGTYDELMLQDGFFKELANRQIA